VTENTQLGQLLARRIAATGPLTLADFMAEALGHPEFGYYMVREPFGAQGDFITAPEISQMFGELCGLWLADQWDRMGRPSPVRLVELGPGRGTLMRDCLRAMAAMPGNFAKVRVRFTVMPDGSAGKVHAVSNSPRPLAQVAVKAVEQWRFEGVKEPQEVEVEVDFKLDE